MVWWVMKSAPEVEEVPTTTTNTTTTTTTTTSGSAPEVEEIGEIGDATDISRGAFDFNLAAESDDGARSEMGEECAGRPMGG